MSDAVPSAPICLRHSRADAHQCPSGAVASSDLVVTFSAETIGGGDAALAARLTELWETPGTWLTRLSTVDHKTLGKRYVYTAFVFFLLGGLEAILTRAQLARPEARFLAPETYNQLMTMHGVTMMFLFIQPVLSSFSFYLTPLMIGRESWRIPSQRVQLFRFSSRRRVHVRELRRERAAACRMAQLRRRVPRRELRDAAANRVLSWADGHDGIRAAGAGMGPDR
jgi:hypothetical protein